MEDYSDLQVARRVSRLIHNEGASPTFPLIGCMWFFLIIAIMVAAVQQLLF